MKFRGLLLAAALLCLIGCAGSGDGEQRETGGTRLSEPLRDQLRWPFWPAAMRVHPLSRLVTISGEASETVIEARVEFLDREGHTTKGFGTVGIDLFDAGRPGSSPMLHWKRDLRDLEQNAEHFDDVTRTYLFKLEVDTNLPERPRLVVVFESADGDRLQAERELRR